jgi:hypothetical protein
MPPYSVTEVILPPALFIVWGVSGKGNQKWFKNSFVWVRDIFSGIETIFSSGPL